MSNNFQTLLSFIATFILTMHFKPVDLDASCVMFDGETYKEAVYFNKLRNSNGSVVSLFAFTDK